MKKYAITTRETVINYYTVEAETEEMARRAVVRGTVDVDDYESIDCHINYCEEVKYN